MLHDVSEWKKKFSVIGCLNEPAQMRLKLKCVNNVEINSKPNQME